MKGMDATTGRLIEGGKHLGQSVSKCITTPLETRINRRLFGSELFNLVDAPTNAATRLRLYAAVATVLMRYEPRLRLTRVGVVIDPAIPGAVVIEVEGVAKLTADAVSFRTPLQISGGPQR